MKLGVLKHLVRMSNGCHFAEKLLLCWLKTFVLLKFMIIQLFARYSKLSTYMSVAAISSDILVYAFFFNLEALKGVAFTFPCITVTWNPFCLSFRLLPPCYVLMFTCFYQYIRLRIEIHHCGLNDHNTTLFLLILMIYSTYVQLPDKISVMNTEI